MEYIIKECLLPTLTTYLHKIDINNGSEIEYNL